MFNEILEGVQHIGIHYPTKHNEALVIDIFVFRITIANPKYMFNFHICFFD